MTTNIDRKKLEEAIQAVHSCKDPDLVTLRAAVEAYLATLPERPVKVTLEEMANECSMGSINDEGRNRRLFAAADALRKLDEFVKGLQLIVGVVGNICIANMMRAFMENFR